MEFKNKTVYIISREDWGGMLMSKQHYAVELSRLGNRVFFINHPDIRQSMKRGEIKIEKTSYDNLWAVSHRLMHPYFFKFKYMAVYNFLTSLHIKRLIKKIGYKPDVVWLFDIGNSLPLKYFPTTARKIYMPVDGPHHSIQEKEAIKTAELILSVTDVIMDQYKNVDLPKYVLNHGVAEAFINNDAKPYANIPLRIGYSGSLVRNDLDIPTFKKIITSHPDKIFEFWGENDFMKSNIHLPQDVSQNTKDFLSFLNTAENVVMHGPVNPNILAEGLKKMDALLICYNIKNDQNHHKVLEYLGTGKVIISSYMSSYSTNTELIEMAQCTENNDELPELFNKVISGISQYNTTEKFKRRIAFAKQYSYPTQIKKIETLLNT